MFVRAQNLIHEMDSPDAEFEWEEPIPSAEREPVPDASGPGRSRRGQRSGSSARAPRRGRSPT